MKNKIFSLILLVLLSLPGVNVGAEADPTSLAQEEVVQEQVVTDNNDLITETEVTTEDEQIPVQEPTRREKLVRKFLAAMLGVVASSLILYIGLSVYNKVRENIINQVKTPEGETSLETPDDLQDAVKTFLDKTDWK